MVMENREEPLKASAREREEEEMGFQTPLRTSKSTSQISGGGGMGKMALVALGVAVGVMVVMSAMGGGFFVTKADFSTNMANMAISLQESTASMNTAVEGLPNTISVAVSNAINQEMSGINQSISQMREDVSLLDSAVATKIADLDAKIVTLQTQVTDYEDRIAILEEEEEEEAAAEESGDILVELKTLGDLMIQPREAGDWSSIPVKAVLTNELGSEVEDIVLVVYVSFSRSLPEHNDPLLTGGVTSWSCYGDYTRELIFLNSWGLKLDAGEKKTLWLTLMIPFTDAVTSQTVVEFEVEVDDYDVVS